MRDQVIMRDPESAALGNSSGDVGVFMALPYTAYRIR